MALELLNLYEGSPCMINNVTGKCVSIYNCLSSYIDLGNKIYAPICSLKGKEPIICCTDCTFNDTRNMIINPNIGILHKTENKVQNKCIENIDRLDYGCKLIFHATMSRVYNPEINCYDVKINVETRFGGGRGGVGGTDAYRNEFPHMALLGYGDEVKTASWLCGGSVISDRFILTAGHCLSSPKLGLVKYITLGILKRSDPPELWQIYNVKRRIPHPEYKSPSRYNDIALLETDIEIRFSNAVLPACLHTNRNEVYQSANALGWGALGYKRELADTLQTVPVTEFEEDECFKYYSPHRHLKNGYNHATQMCYGDKKILRDTCEGDSGGPLIFHNDSSNLFCIYTIIGVTSSGTQCGIAPSPGIYTRVIYYIPWIESVVWP
ncbi:hypothetical protein PYW08_004346 [Mythimna loreyi]|uniref:Uncharacterized protein n=1 Tax=Mythimna loreyi TaxID=667449 RepID=A0ACC2QPQ3_9NEOP|nr:hypothetical protein PYW08_004346 [Mythimna loreyi]